MRTFNIDLIHPGGFAKTWLDYFGALQAGKRLLRTYVSEVLTVLESVGVNIPRLYALYSERKARRAQRIYTGGKARIQGAIATFRIDILHTGGFAKTWRDWFVDPQAVRKLVFSYIFGVVVILAIIAMGIPRQHALHVERRTINELQQKITQRKKDFKDQQNQFLGIVELRRYEVAWSGVLRALSGSMPTDLWLKSIEFVDVPSTPKPRAVAAKEAQVRSQQLFRLVLVAPLSPGSGHLVDVNKFLDNLGKDSRFKKRFRLHDWQVVPSRIATGKKAEQHIVATITYKVVS